MFRVTPVIIIFIIFSAITVVAYVLEKAVRRYSVPPDFFVVFVGTISFITAYATGNEVHLQGFGKAYILILLPLIYLRLIYCTDMYTLIRCKYQILIICTLGFSLSSIMNGFVISMIFQIRVQEGLYSLMSGVIMTYTIVPNWFLVTDTNKQVFTILCTESSFGLAIATTLCDIFKSLQLGEDLSYAALTALLYGVVIATLVGLVLGKLAAIVFNMIAGDLEGITCLLVATTYFAAALLFTFKIQGTLAALSACLIMGLSRSRFSPELDKSVTHFITSFDDVLNIHALLCSIIYMGHRMLLNITVLIFLKSLAVYILATATRFTTYLIISPLLSRIECGLKFTNMFTLFWSRHKSCMHLILIDYFVHYPVLNVTDYNDVACYVTISVLLDHLVHVLTIPAFMRRLKVSGITSANKSNIANAFGMIIDKKSKNLTLIRLNRKLSDANWELVYKCTDIKFPFPDEDLTDYNAILKKQKYSQCSTCLITVVVKPSRKEYRNLKKEASLRVLAIEKVSFMRQYHCGLITDKAMKALLLAVDIAHDSSNSYVKMGNVEIMFNKKRHTEQFKRFLIWLMNIRISTRIPRQPLRRAAYKITYTVWFNIACPILDICWGIYMIVQLSLEVVEIFVSRIVGGTILGAFATEFVLKWLAASSVSLQSGFKIYWRSHWSKIDFTFLILHSLYYTIRFAIAGDWILMVHRCIQSIKIIYILKFTRSFLPRIISWVDRTIDMDVTNTYSIGMALVEAYEEVLCTMEHLVGDLELKAEFIDVINNDRLALSLEMARVQTKKPWISSILKTKRCILATMRVLRYTVIELYITGMTDFFEHSRLLQSAIGCLKFAYSSKRCALVSPRELFYNVCWTVNDDKLMAYLYENLASRIWHAGEVVCENGKHPEGIYIVIQGFLKMTYIPDTVLIDYMNESGTLPIIDLIRTTVFANEQQEYIIKGNSFGELSVLTDRPYNCTIVSMTATQAFLIPTSIAKQAMEMCNDPVDGLKSRLWKYVTKGLAKVLLIQAFAYQAITYDRMNLILQKAIVPKLDAFNTLHTSRFVEDILLLEGIVFDEITREVYFAPCYIPRSVTRIRISYNLDLKRNKPVLMMLPSENADEYETMLKIEESSELLSTASSNMLVGSFLKSKRHRSKRRLQTLNIAKRSGVLDPLALSPRKMNRRVSSLSSTISASTFDSTTGISGSSTESGKRLK